MTSIGHKIGQFADWTTDPSTPAWKGALAVGGTIAAIMGVIFGTVFLILALTHTHVSCPAGQSLQVVTYTTTYVPAGNGTVIPIITPVWACLPDH